MYNEAEIKAYSSEKSNNDWINEMKRLPRWVKTLYCYPVKCYDKRIKVVKVYSDELITCLPTISNLEKSKQMNQIFNVFGKLDFSKVRDCLVL